MFGLYQSHLVFTIKLFKMKNSVFVFVFALLVTFSCAKEKTLFVADHYADCVGSAPQKCLMVKENEGEDWQMFYDQIEGFNYEEGYFYELKVKVTPVKNPPADSSSLYYTLIKVVSKTKVEVIPTQAEIGNNGLEGNWEVIEITGFENKTGVNPTFSINENKINGKNGCNNFGGDIKIGEEGKLSISDLYQTKMFCMDEAALEMHFMEALRNTAGYKIENGNLFMIDATQKTVFKAVQKQSTESSSAVSQQDQSYEITYNTSTRGFSKEWVYNGKTLVIHQQLPETSDKTVQIPEQTRKEIDQLFKKIDVSKLESLTPPSTNHQFDGARHAAFTVEMNGKKYQVPTFDHGNPPDYIKNVLEKLEKLASE